VSVSNPLFWAMASVVVESSPPLNKTTAFEDMGANIIRLTLPGGIIY
jgi:hypothetical protein